MIVCTALWATQEMVMEHAYFWTFA